MGLGESSQSCRCPNPFIGVRKGATARWSPRKARMGVIGTVAIGAVSSSNSNSWLAADKPCSACACLASSAGFCGAK